MNQIAWQIYGGSKAKANTFIGGVASTITTSGALATKLGIASNRITNFKIVGSNIECRISGSYSIPAEAFRDDTSITYYKDYENLISTGFAAFFHLTSGVNMALTELYFENATTIGSDICQLNGTGTYPLKRAIFPKATTFIGQRHFVNQKNIETVYIPLVTTLGSSVGNQQIFEFTNYASQKRLYVHPSLATNNAGAPDGDITNAIANGWIVRYVTNFTAPNPITNLSVGNVYGTAVQLNFTAPTGSTNAIDYYELWQNGVNTGKTVTASGQYITGLTLNTAYTIEVKPVDIFYNKSTSNVVSQTTLATPVYQDSLVSYYKMENNVLDSFGANNGTATAITYASGLVGQTAVFNGTTSNIKIPHSNSLSFGDGINDFPFSVSFNIKFANKATLAGYIPFAKSNNANNVNDEYYLTIYNNFIYWRLMDKNTIGSHIGFSYNMASLSNNVSYNFSFTYDGSKTNNGIKFYINGILTSTTPFSAGTYTGMNIGTHQLAIGSASDNNFKLSGEMDEVSIFNTALTAGQVTEINAKLNTGQSLI